MVILGVLIMVHGLLLTGRHLVMLVAAIVVIVVVGRRGRRGLRDGRQTAQVCCRSRCSRRRQNSGGSVLLLRSWRVMVLKDTRWQMLHAARSPVYLLDGARGRRRGRGRQVVYSVQYGDFVGGARCVAITLARLTRIAVAILVQVLADEFAHVVLNGGVLLLHGVATSVAHAHVALAVLGPVAVLQVGVRDGRETVHDQLLTQVLMLLIFGVVAVGVTVAILCVVDAVVLSRRSEQVQVGVGVETVQILDAAGAVLSASLRLDHTIKQKKERKFLLCFMLISRLKSLATYTY